MQVRCDNSNVPQQLHVTSTVSMALKQAIGSNMDVKITLPSLAATASVYLSGSPSVERSFGKVALEGFQFEAAHNDSIGALVEVGVTDANVLRTIYLATDTATENMTFLIKGFNKTVEDDQGNPTLMEKMLTHMEYRQLVTPSDYNPPAPAAATADSVRHSLLSLSASHDGSTTATVSAQYQLHPRYVKSILLYMLVVLVV